MKLTETQIRWFRFRRSGLAEPFSSPEEAARSLVGVQAQILPAAGLALWNRTRGLTYADFDNRLHIQRSLIRIWGQRGTLHVYTSDEWPLLNGAMVGRHSWWERQMVRAGTDPDDYQVTLDRVAELLRQRGTMNRSNLRASGLVWKRRALTRGAASLPTWCGAAWPATPARRATRNSLRTGSIGCLT